MKQRFVSLMVLAGLLAGMVTFPTVGNSSYLYRQRLNWVKIDEAPSKLLATGRLRHPFAGVSDEQMEAMLLSVTIAKKHLLKKEVETVEVFNSWEARRFAPHLVKALAEIDPDHVVLFSVIHKRPLFVLRNDRLSMGMIWASEEGLHLRFSKLFAKIAGDYEASANMDKAVRKAKTIRVTLEAREGQKLSYESPTEVIFDPQFDFISVVAVREERQQAEEEELLKGKRGKKRPKKMKETAPESRQSEQPPVAAPQPAPAPQPRPAQSESVTERLRELERLKKEKLISNEEYQSLRKKILSEI